MITAPVPIAGELGDNSYALFAAIVLLTFAAAIVFLILRLFGSASIIRSANNIVVYRQSTIGAIFFESKKYIKRLFLLELVVTIAVLVLATLLLVPVAYLFALNVAAWTVIFFAMALVILIPLLVLVYYVRRFAYMYIIIGEMDIKTSLDAAYGLLEKNFSSSLLAGCIAIALNIALWVLIFCVIIVIVLVIAPFAAASYFIFAQTGLMVVLLLGALLLILALLIIFSWFEAYLQTFWVLFFQQISLEKQEEKKILEKLEIDGKIPTPEAV